METAGKTQAGQLHKSALPVDQDIGGIYVIMNYAEAMKFGQDRGQLGSDS